MPTHELISDSAIGRIECFIDRCLVDGGIPGLSVALVSPDEILYSNGFGAANLSQNKPMTPDTLYGIGSCTKSFTTLGILQLVEDGELDLHDPVSDHIDLYTDAPGDPITIHELMSHGSGMPSDATAVALISRAVMDESMTAPLSSTADFSRHVNDSVDWRTTEEETPFFYYNSGYTALGEVIEAVSGQPYREYVQEQILAPLGMTRSTFEREAFDDDDDGMTGYYEDDGELTKGSFPHDRIIDAPGGLLSSVRELSTYLQIQMNGGEHDDSRLVTEESISAIHSPYTTREVRLDGTNQEYGYGWMIQDFLNDRLIGHGGSISVSTSYVGFLEETGIGVCIGCNTSSTIHPMYIGPAILALVDGNEPTTVPFFALREKAERVTGSYASHRNLVEATVERNGPRLSLSMMGQQYSLHPQTTDSTELVFETVVPSGGTAEVIFSETDDGFDLFFQRWRLRHEL